MNIYVMIIKPCLYMFLFYIHLKTLNLHIVSQFIIVEGLQIKMEFEINLKPKIILELQITS